MDEGVGGDTIIIDAATVLGVVEVEDGHENRINDGSAWKMVAVAERTAVEGLHNLPRHGLVVIDKEE